jgi:MFS-type transporter involved in bile tolerance (Atg22 family)
MNAHGQEDLWAIFIFVVGAVLPLLGSAMIPNGRQRMAGAIFALIGIAVLVGMVGNPSNAMRWGLSVGFILAATKLVAGIRFL